MTISPVGRTGRVINSPNSLALRMHADLKSDVRVWLPNGTTFKIKGVADNFYEVYVQAFAASGFVWTGTGTGADDHLHYVELVPVQDRPGDTRPPYPPFKPPASGGSEWKTWGIGGLIVAALGALVYAFGGPVK